MKINIFIIIIFALLCFNCNAKKSAESMSMIISDAKHEEIVSVFNLGYDIVYAVPFEGLNLYSEPDFNSELIKHIPRNTKLAVLEINEECEIINGTDYYWYKVDSGNGTGWAFGDYLFDKPVPNKIKNLKMAKTIASSDNLINNKNGIYFIENSIFYNNKNLLKLYENNSFESNFSNTNHEQVFLFKYDELGWYYLISNNCEKEGFIYIYEIPNESFYGDLEENAKSGNYYRYMQNMEYEIVMRNGNIKRYGPLLSINHNNKTKEFLDTHNGGTGGISYLLLDYYKRYDELLILKQYWDYALMSIYNIKQDQFTCENIRDPAFNNTRTYMLSFAFVEQIGYTIMYSLKLFSVNDGIYNEIYNENIETGNNWKLNEMLWKNNNMVYIDYGEKGNIIAEIGRDVRVNNNLASIDEIMEEYPAPQYDANSGDKKQ